MRRGRTGLAVVVALTLLVAGCSSSKPSSVGLPFGIDYAGDLTGVTWVLSRPSVKLLAPNARKGLMIDLEFDGSHVSGVAGCFSYSGDYRADHANGAMQISILSSTQAACDPSMMNLELAYFSALGNFTSYLVSGDPPYADLVLIGGNKSVVFTPKS